jgi:sialate O-acetylesterase
MPVRADVSVAPIFSNSMVLQREQPVPVWGKAAPGEAVTVEFAGQQVAGKADAAGKWKVVLKAMPANATPQEMKVGAIVFKDVLVGEVWLCSGQSNMGLEVRKAIHAEEDIAKANYPAIRAFIVGTITSTNGTYPIIPTIEKQRYPLTPQERCEGTWKVCTPANVVNWSAAGYFFARNIHERLKVPVGIIVASMGATAIESWISVEGLKAVPAYHERAVSFETLAKAFVADTNSYPASLEAEKVRVAGQTKTWFNQLDAEEPGFKNNWMAPTLDTTKWDSVTLPVSTADNPIGAVVASIWFRKQVTVPADWVGKELELQLGLIDGTDEAYVNGVRVGRTWFDTANYWLVSRVYPVPAAAVTSTNVTLALRVLKLAYPMGLFGSATNMVLTLKDAPATTVAVSVTGEWRMAKSQDLDAGRQPRPAALLEHIPGNYYGHPGVQYNGQIHPLIPYAIRGAIWYQGEANAPFYVDYRSLLPGLIKSWRNEWGQGDFAFGIVALADYWGQQTKPVERGVGYQLIRDAQAMALSLTNTFLATAVGVGEGADIHPKRKQEVGRRLAWAALGTVYGQTAKPYIGPMYKSMAIEGSKIRLRFDFATGLHAEGEPPVGFAIAGADRTYYFAKAKIDGDTVVVWSDKVPQPIAVRYAWATNPVCNLYNSENLPLFQFHTDNWDQSQLVIPADTITIPTGWLPK